MAHSCIEYRGRTAFIRDSDLVLAMRYVERLLTRNPSVADFSFPAPWYDAIENRIPGAIDFDLDRHLDAPAACDGFVRALEAAKADLRTRGDDLPGDEVDALMWTAARFVGPSLPTAKVGEIFDGILSIVRPSASEASSDTAGLKRSVP